MPLPSLPQHAVYLHLLNPARRNALSLAVLRSLKSQLLEYNTSPSGRTLLLPPFHPSILSRLESQDPEYDWLIDVAAWRREREGLPKVIVLRSKGTVFSSGHDLVELRKASRDEVKETFRLCAEVMALIRRSPVVVVGVVQGLATAAGAQLALTTDIPIALSSTLFRLPGATIGLPCTSPSTIFSRQLNPSQAYRMLALAEPVRADQLSGAVDSVPDPAEGNPTSAIDSGLDLRVEALECRVEQVVMKLINTATQPTALGKWAFWTQVGLDGSVSPEGGGVGGCGGDGYEDAVSWSGRVMALHSQAGDAKEGIGAFFGKKAPSWKT